jgi:hypothetical protein
VLETADQALLFPPIVGEDSVRNLVKGLIVRVQFVLICKLTVNNDAIVPNDLRTGDGFVDLFGEEVQP